LVAEEAERSEPTGAQEGTESDFQGAEVLVQAKEEEYL